MVTFKNSTFQLSKGSYRVLNYFQVKIRTEQEFIPVGCVPSAAMAICGGGVVCPGGSAGGCVSQLVMGQTPSCGQTDTCKNITFPQLLLRTVMIYITNLNLCISADLVVGATGRFSREIQKRVPGSESSAFYIIAHKLYLA